MPEQENDVVTHGVGSENQLRLRVAAMINSPLAQLERRVVVHRVDTDSDYEWQSTMELLADTDGLTIMFRDEGCVLLKWDAPTNDDQRIVRGKDVALVEHKRDMAI